jgi:hypothetical protein
VVAIHTPEVCYAASGYQVGTPLRFRAANLLEPAEMWTVEMVRRRAAEQTRLRIFYAWNATGAWLASDNPRLAFAGHPVLYKMYLLRDLPGAGAPLDNDPCFELLRQLQPALQRCLFATDTPVS